MLSWKNPLLDTASFACRATNARHLCSYSVSAKEKAEELLDDNVESVTISEYLQVGGPTVDIVRLEARRPAWGSPAKALGVDPQIGGGRGRGDRKSPSRTGYN